MHIDEVSGSALVALAIFTHAWTARITAPPHVLSVIGWVMNLLTLLAIASIWIRG